MSIVTEYIIIIIIIRATPLFHGCLRHALLWDTTAEEAREVYKQFSLVLSVTDLNVFKKYIV